MLQIAVEIPEETRADAEPEAVLEYFTGLVNSAGLDYHDIFWGHEHTWGRYTAAIINLGSGSYDFEDLMNFKNALDEEGDYDYVQLIYEVG